MSKANAATNQRQATRLPPALNPEQPALTQPWRDFVSRGFVTSLDVKFSGGTTSVMFELGPMVKTPPEQNRSMVAPGAAKHYIIESGLWSPASQQKNKPGKKEDGVQLPKKSLVKNDFMKSTSDEDLLARATAVAEALTDTVARGRIGSLKFMRKGVDSFEIWWAKAPAEMKTRLLMDQKHHLALSDNDHSRFAGVVVKCPFRGPVPTPSPEEEPEKETKLPVNPRGGNGKPSSPPKK